MGTHGIMLGAVRQLLQYKGVVVDDPVWFKCTELVESMAGVVPAVLAPAENHSPVVENWPLPDWWKDASIPAPIWLRAHIGWMLRFNLLPVLLLVGATKLVGNLLEFCFGWNL